MTARKSIGIVVVSFLSLALAQASMAQGVGNLPALPTQFETGTPATGWNVVGTNGTPIPVVYDPTGPVWGKNFTGPNGTNFFQPAGGPPLQVQEHLLVSGTLPWTDWHEDVLDPSWSWSNPFILVNGQVPNNLTTSLSGGSLSFFFDPIAPGSLVDIRKELIYNGVPGTTFIGTLPIHEYPTPEPASFGLMSILGLCALRRR